MERFRYFIRYFMKYLLVYSLVVIGCVPFAFMSYNHIRQNKISENITKIKSGMVSFEDNIQKMRMLSSLMSEDPRLLELEVMKSDIPFSHWLHLKYIKEQMFDISLIYDYSSFMFILFRDNLAFISMSQVTVDYSKIYGSFFNTEKYDATSFKALLFDRKNMGHFVNLTKVKYFTENSEKSIENALLFIAPLHVESIYMDSKAVMGFVIDTDKIADTLLTPDVSKSGMIRMTDKAGNIILSYGAKADLLVDKEDGDLIRVKDDDYYVISYKDIESGLNVQLGYPMMIVDAQMHDIVILLIIYAIIGLLISIIMVVYFSKRWFKPISRLILTTEELEGTSLKKVNEYDYIRESILKLVSEKDELLTNMLISDTQKQAIMLENVFIKGFYQKSEEEAFLKQFPLAAKEYRVVYMQIKEEYLSKDEESHVALMEGIHYLENQLDSGFIHVHAMNNTQILLLPEIEGVDEQQIEYLFRGMIASIKKHYTVECSVGISLSQNLINHINVAYSQARQTVQAYLVMESDFVEFYQLVEEDDNTLNIHFLNRLHDLILSGNKAEVKLMFQNLREVLGTYKVTYEMQKAELFHTIAFFEYTAYKEVFKNSSDELKMPQYQENHSLEECIEVLENTSDDICNLIEENKTKRNSVISERILDYLANNYTRSELTIELAATELGISDRHLSSSLRSYTGKTFSVYLDELRIQAAKTYLSETDWINDRIAQECGFGATNSFYRIFKKYVNMTPNAYKKYKQESTW